MSKEEQARVRDELLQTLYAGVLRCTLAAAREKTPVKQGDLSPAVASGVGANLQAGDVLVLPSRGAGAFRLLRDLPFRVASHDAARELAAGVLHCSGDIARDVAATIGAAIAARAAGRGQIVLVVIPRAGTEALLTPVKLSKRFPATWAETLEYASQHGLPLLMVAEHVPGELQGPKPEESAPDFPTIPVDREDALGIYRVAFECASRARTGGGPSLVACVPFKVRGKTAEPGPLARLEAALRARRAFGSTWRSQLERLLTRRLTDLEF